MGMRRWPARRPRLTAIFALLGALFTLAACAGSAPGVTVNALRWTAHGVVPVLPRQLGLDARAAQLVGRMSLADKLGQLIIIQYTDTTYTAQQAALVQPFHPGGVILYGYAMGSAQQARALIAAGQHDSPIPLFVFTDLEGGVVDRLAESGYLAPRMGAPAIAATGDPYVAAQQGAQTARDLLSYGFNADLAPDVDVAVVAGPDQWGRTFGSTPPPVTTFAGAWLQGLQMHGVVGALKHFPGLGAATTDAHLGLPVIDRTRAQLESTELAPYRDLIASGQAHMIMSTDVLMPALDPSVPAEISKPIITGILRNELHYDGVAITDALYMAGIANHYSFGQAAVLAIEAGNDMIMAPWTPSMEQSIVDGLKQALANGSLSMAQVDNSVRRIIALKMRFRLLPGPPPTALGLRDESVSDADLPQQAPQATPVP
jgi:beta-N-acetylhexosaminidase